MEQPPPASAEAVRSWDRPAVMVPFFVLLSLIGGLFGSFTLTANLLVLALGGTMIWLGLTGRAGRRAAATRMSPAAAWWLVPVVSLAALELVTFSKHSIVDYPTLSLVADPLLEHYLVRSAAYFGWLFGFWGLIRR